MYRHYDARGRVLYVGCTVNLERRNYVHKRNAKWWDLSVKCEVVPCATREIAEDYEWREIERLEPLYNLHCNPRYYRWGPMPKRHDHPPTWMYELHVLGPLLAAEGKI